MEPQTSMTFDLMARKSYQPKPSKQANQPEKQPTLSKNGKRIGRPPLNKKKIRKRRGRKRKIHEFNETRLGFLLQHEAPLEYHLIVNRLCGAGRPEADLIESVGYSSSNPLFKKPKFRRALIDYRLHGIRGGRAVKQNAVKEVYYAKIRKNTLGQAKGEVK